MKEIGKCQLKKQRLQSIKAGWQFNLKTKEKVRASMPNAFIVYIKFYP